MAVKFSKHFEIYEEIKQAGDVPKSKAIRSLIGSLEKQGEFAEMFQVLHEYKDKEEWYYACSFTFLSFILSISRLALPLISFGS